MLFNLPFFDTILKCVIIPNLQKRKQGQRGICKVTQPVTNRFPPNRASQMARVLKSLPANAGDIRDAGSIPGSGRSPGGGHGNPLQHSCLQSLMDRRAWRATVHRVAKSQTQPKRLSARDHSILASTHRTPLRRSC